VVPVVVVVAVVRVFDRSKAARRFRGRSVAQQSGKRERG
jgi:hypothetical protein